MMISRLVSCQTSISALLSSMNVEVYHADAVWIHVEYIWRGFGKRGRKLHEHLDDAEAFLYLSLCYRADPKTAGQQTLAHMHISSHYQIKGEKRTSALKSLYFALCLK